MPARPNVLLIIMDDLAYGDLSCHGNPHTSTEHLDALHHAGARLTRYCSGPLCSPARACLMTGRYHQRTRVLDTYCGRSMLDPDEITLAELLRRGGYRTGAFGKWHLGDCYPMRAMDLGFEQTLMHLAGGIGQPGDHPDNHAREPDSYFDPVLFRNGVPEPSQGYCTDVFAEATMRFIREHQAEPFFAYLATNAPHSPFTIGEEWVEPFRAQGVNETHARVYGMVQNIDWNVGRVLGTLAELGLGDDTIVIYTSDHGPCGSARDRSAPAGEGDRFNCGLRGRKGTMYQGGIQVPCFWRWRGRFPAQSIDRVAHPIDVLPTIAAACDQPLPDDRVIDGASLLPLLTGETSAAEWPDRAVVMQWHRGDEPVPYRNFAVIGQRYKLTRRHEAEPDELYDLESDPAEERNLAAGEPGLVEAMRARYDEWLNDVASTRGPGTFDPPRIGIGTPHENPTLLTQNDWRTHGAEGWRTDNLRGHWEVAVESPGPYRVTVRARPGVPAGTVHLTAADGEWTARAEADETATVLDGVRLREGPGRVEAWRASDEPLAGAYRERFVPALYVELERVT